MNTQYRESVEDRDLVSSNIYMRGVYRWMTVGLFLTAICSFFMISSGLVSIISPTAVMLLLFVELGLVFYFIGKIQKLSARNATAIFITYSALNGITFAPLMYMYTASSVVGVFVITAGMFGAMSLYGMYTKKDLTSFGSFLIMGLVGVIIASIVNIFLQSSALYFAISYLGVFIFLGLTAYDTQKLKEFSRGAPSDSPELLQKGVIMGALTLYLDFINLFIYLLRILGVRKD
ncbi:MAG: Bax inhibitor-1/YccA family protein [Desulfovibrionaceae bacterium]